MLCRGKLADPGDRLLGRQDQQAVASQSPAAEHAAAASSAHQTETLNTVVPSSTARNRASSAQGHAPAKSSNAARTAAKEPAQAGQHSSQHQQAKELLYDAQNSSKAKPTANHPHLLRQAQTSDMAALQAASNTAAPFTGFA